MHLVFERDDDEVEVDLRLLHPDATVGDLSAVVDPDGPGPRGIIAGGRRLGPELALADLGLTNGTGFRVSDERAAGRPPARLVGRTLAVVGGPDAGHLVTLAPGRPVTLGRAAPAELVLGDATASGLHARVDLVADGSVTLTDLGSTNGTFVDGHRVTGTVAVTLGALLQIGATQFRVLDLDDDDRPVGSPASGAGATGTVAFNRPPRPALDAHLPPRPLPDPPAEARGVQGVGLAAMIIGPLLMGGVMVAIYRDLRFAAFMLLSPVLGIGNWLSSRRRSKKEHTSNARDHRAAIVALDRDLLADAEAEVAVRERLLPDPAEVLRRALQPSVSLWQRRPGHDDWLRLRAGSGTVPWSPLAADERRPRPDLDELRTRHAELRACPVEVDLSNGGVVGLVGDRASALALARSLLVQACVHHGPADLVLAVASAPAHAGDWDWAKWLPHLRAPSGSGRLVATDPVGATALFGALGGRAPLDGRVTQAPAGPTVLVVVDDVSLLEGRRSPARDLLRGSGGPVAGIVVAASEDQLPAMCTTVITTTAAIGELSVRRPHAGLRHDDVTTSALTDRSARTCARALARFEDPELGLVGGGLPDVVRLLPILGLDDVTPEAVLAGWSALPHDPAPAAPLGVGEDGVLTVDLAADGPHALIGGTTGSGKSELLRSLVAGLAARLDPDHLVFVLVDYKGGSAFDECARLPHTVGMVTDLDESLGERALRSLEAELHHRERLLRDAGTQDLPAYLAGGSPAGPLPRLVVVIDEFATLAAELPDFLGALVGIAQRGRSLGVHLILATQRPQGAVNANIKANTNLRIALRVQDAGDSADIIDQGSAADLSRSTPGRAYVRRGPGEVELVQSALSTAAAQAGPTRPVELLPFRLTAHDAPIAVGTDDEGAGASDLYRLVEAVREAFVRSGAAEPRQPWLPVLTEHLAFADLPASGPGAVLPATGLGAVTIGLADEPAHQRQGAAVWDTTEGHLAVIGMVGSGTSTALLTVARALTDRFGPDRIHLYGLDFGNQALSGLTALPHCGGVIGATDREGQFQLVRRLKAELDRRRSLPPEARAALATVVVLIDGIGAFLAEHAGIESAELTETFTRLVNEGPGVNLLFVLAAERPAALPHRLGGAVNQKILLRLTDPSDYAAVGVRLREAPKFPPGRGHRSDGALIQLAVPGDPGAWSDVPAGSGPAPLQAFATRVSTAEVRATGAVPVLEPVVSLPVGLDEDHRPVSLLLHAGEHALIAGAPRSGVSSTLVQLAESLRAAHRAGGQDVVVAAVHDGRSPLSRCQEVDVSGVADGFEEIYAAALADERPWFLLIDDAPRVEDVDGALARLVASGRPGLHVVAGGRATDFQASLGHWTRRIGRSRTGILLQPDLALDGDLLGLRLPRRLTVAVGPGRGFVVTAGEARLTQLALPSVGDRSPMTNGPHGVIVEPSNTGDSPVPPAQGANPCP